MLDEILKLTHGHEKPTASAKPYTSVLEGLELGHVSTGMTGAWIFNDYL